MNTNLIVNANNIKFDKSSMVNNTFYVTYAFLLTTATITFIEAISTKTPQIRHIMNLETVISVVAAYFYKQFMDKLKINKNLGRTGSGEAVSLIEIDGKIDPELINNGWSYQWDGDALCPYLVKDDGSLVITYENPESRALYSNCFLESINS